jgi:hypothetical protein
LNFSHNDSCLASLFVPSDAFVPSCFVGDGCAALTGSDAGKVSSSQLRAAQD